MNEKNIRLGAFVLSGFVLTVIAFFYISNNSSIFGNYSELKARFANASGLQEGSNVLFSGIDAGTVKSIVLIDERTIEVTLLIDSDIMFHIPKNSLVSIGTEGLLGNKVVNIQPAEGETGKIKEGEFLVAAKKASMDEMLETLARTNDNVADISEALKSTVLKINNSEVLSLLDDKELASDLRLSMRNVQKSTVQAEQMIAALNDIIAKTRQGKGAAGLLLADKKFEDNLQQAMADISLASENANKIAAQLQGLVSAIDKDYKTGNGPLSALLKDSTLTEKINTSLDNIEKGTDGFNQNMEALKHNFLFRRYFRQQEKEKKQE